MKKEDRLSRDRHETNTEINYLGLILDSDGIWDKEG